MTKYDAALEIGKLFIQFLGALFIARMAVSWALHRYKTEKHWDRRLAAYQDVLSAMGSMLDVIGEWLDEIALGKTKPGISEKDQRNRYWSAMRELNNGRHMAELLLPDEVADRIRKLIGDIGSLEPATSRHLEIDELNDQALMIDEARKDIVRLGKINLK